MSKNLKKIWVPGDYLEFSQIKKKSSGMPTWHAVVLWPVYPNGQQQKHTKKHVVYVSVQGYVILARL